ERDVIPIETVYAEMLDNNIAHIHITFDTPVDKDEFEEWVKSLPDTVYRMKGYVPVKGVSNPYLFQYAYGMVNWLPEYVKMDPRLVIIGEGISQIEYVK
ncbi:GTP-binding protein, partial [Sporosarcina sp. SAFN-015]|uniref:GTP-binding protein n=1 Tax=Sporosarcina sp. SAFN-015 TaxID=3387274 RepID=UPI003F8039F5